MQSEKVLVTANPKLDKAQLVSPLHASVRALCDVHHQRIVGSQSRSKAECRGLEPRHFHQIISRVNSRLPGLVHARWSERSRLAADVGRQGRQCFQCLTCRIDLIVVFVVGEAVISRMFSSSHGTSAGKCILPFSSLIDWTPIRADLSVPCAGLYAWTR